MKKYILIVLGMLFYFPVFSQITITESDFASVHDTVQYRVEVQDLENPQFFSSIGNPPWNFSTLRDDDRDTVVFIDPATTPAFADFPDANICVTMNELGLFYLQKTASGVQALGTAAVFTDYQIPFVLPFNEPMTMAKFPMTNNSQFSDDLSQNVRTTLEDLGLDPNMFGFPVDSIKIEISFQIESDVINYGSLKTPLGNYETILEEQTNIIGLNVYVYILIGWLPAPVYTQETNSHTYNWLANNYDMPVMTISERNDTILNINYTNKLGTPNTSITELCSSEPTIFPNPAKNEISIIKNNSEISRCEIISEQGNIVLKNESLNSSSTLNISNLASGIYFIRFFNKNGELIATKKLIKT